MALFNELCFTFSPNSMVLLTFKHWFMNVKTYHKHCLRQHCKQRMLTAKKCKQNLILFLKVFTLDMQVTDIGGIAIIKFIN